jgi:hypothetical protein
MMTVSIGAPCSSPVASHLEQPKDPIESELRALTRRIREVCGSRLYSLVAVGSVGRAYAEQLSASQVKPADYDLLAIVDASKITAFELHRKLERCLVGPGREVRVPVSLGVLRRSELSELPFTLFNYELRYGCRVLEGRDLSQDMAPYNPERMPLIEATRLLLNRGVVLWGDALCAQEGNPCHDDAEALAGRNRKALMAIGDALLIADRRFHWSYHSRVERAETSDRFDRVECPDLRQRYIKAISAKAGAALPKLDKGMLRAEVLKLFQLHQQVLRLVEELRLNRKVTDWSVYGVSDLGYPKYLQKDRLTRITQLILAFGPPRGTGFYRRHWRHSVEEVLIRAFPNVAYRTGGARFLRRALNWNVRSDADALAVWRHFCRLWRGGR